MHIWGGDQANPGIYIPGACVLGGVNTNPCSTTANVNTRRALNLQNAATGRFFGSIAQLNDGGTASYNGLLRFGAERRPRAFRC